MRNLTEKPNPVSHQRQALGAPNPLAGPCGHVGLCELLEVNCTLGDGVRA